MAFRDRAGAFTPVNVFGGLGEGLGQALGGGFTKATKRPLFKKLADDFYNKRQETARLNTLAKLGLQSAPVEGDTQYPIFQQIMDLQMSPVGERTDVFMDRFEAGDDMDQAMKYLLTDPKAQAEKQTKLSKLEMLSTPEAQLAKTNLELADANALKAEAKYGKSPTEANWAELEEAHASLGKAASDFTVAAAGSGVKANDVVPSLSQRMTRMKSMMDVKNLGANLLGKQLAAGEKLAVSSDKAKSLLSARSKALSDDLGEYKKLAEQLKVLINKFNKNPDAEDNGQLYAQAAKTMGLAVEPGLAVTTSEVDLYSGENWATKILGIVPTIIRAAVGFKEADKAKLEKAEADAANQNPFVLQRMLTQAAEAIQAGLNAYQGIGASLADGISKSAADRVNMQMSFVGDNISDERKAQIIADTQRMVKSAGVAQDLETYQPNFPQVLSPSGSFPEEEGGTPPPEAGFGTPKAGGEDLSLGGVVNSTIEEAAGNATATDAVVSGLTSGGKKVTAEELRAKMKAKRAGQ